ncbi:MAG: ROK family protein, partial [Frankiaceae bacterium]
NDANAAAWGEFKFGAGRGIDDAIVLTVGTGIGGGLILDGQLLRGHWGIAAEVGHITAVVGGRRCGCGNRGCWEQYVSGRALIREAREIASVEPGRARRLLDLGGGVPEGILGPHVTLAAREGDNAAREVFDVMGRWLGYGMATLAAVLDPGLFIISGGVSEAGDLLITPTRAAFRELLTGHDARPEAQVMVAQLGNGAGVVGAADLARHWD